MVATPETGFLVIADLTGYTAYLAGSELDEQCVRDVLGEVAVVLDAEPARMAWSIGRTSLS